MSFGARIQHMRHVRGMSQQDLVAATGLQQTAISRLEHDGVPNPGAAILKRLARALGCSIDYLVGTFEDMPVGASTP